MTLKGTRFKSNATNQTRTMQWQVPGTGIVKFNKLTQELQRKQQAKHKVQGRREHKKFLKPSHSGGQTSKSTGGTARPIQIMTDNIDASLTAKTGQTHTKGKPHTKMA